MPRPRLAVGAAVLVGCLLGTHGAPPTLPAGATSARSAVGATGDVADPPAHAVVTYAEPVTPFVVVRGFVPPVTRYGPGHRGVDLRSTAGEPVVAAADGTVAFAGQVGGRGVVVLAHADGIRTEYEPARPVVGAGQSVRRGQVIGHVDGLHAGCTGSCLHWGARRGDTYLDPLSLLHALGAVTLLPW